VKKYVFPAIVLLICLIALARTFMREPAPLAFSPGVSVLVIIMLGLAMLAVLALTVRGIYVERRWVFLFVGVALVLPYFMKITLKTKVSPEVRGLYESVSELPPGSKVLAAFDFDPPSAPELQPMADAFMAYAFKHDLKVIIIGLWPQGPQQANLSVVRALADAEIAAKSPKYGTDYVNLGFQSGNEFVIQSMGSSFRSMFPRDIYSTNYDEIPLLNGVQNFNNVDFVINFSAGYPGTKEWVQIAVDRFNVKVGAGNTAVQAPEMYPYLNAKQLTGLAGGMTGAAEFELALEERGRATVALLSQLFSHAVVIGFIIIGNVALFLDKRRKAGVNP
jgi:hypothetical protein